MGEPRWAVVYGSPRVRHPLEANLAAAAFYLLILGLSLLLCFVSCDFMICVCVFVHVLSRAPTSETLWTAACQFLCPWNSSETRILEQVATFSRGSCWHSSRLVSLASPTLSKWFYQLSHLREALYHFSLSEISLSLKILQALFCFVFNQEIRCTKVLSHFKRSYIFCLLLIVR